ncbi:sensor histidine kinase [uncultured Thiohalocapsa sp.]|uniref:sensor histidine kinase n=1 Tax=uncultured Thiohalocapsa sp. TaxID=768990 RepID=UPI0025FE353E|nr:sensor histidine kinase [uncultured Thiohalocapsa sp.]
MSSHPTPDRPASAPAPAGDAAGCAPAAGKGLAALRRRLAFTPRDSLENRLGLGLGLSLALLIGAAWWLGHVALHRTTDAYVLSRLEHDTQALLGRLEHIGDLERAAHHLLPVYRQPFSGHYFKVLTAAGAVRSRSLWDQDLALDPVPVGAVRNWYTDGPAEQPLLVRAAGYRMGEGPVTIAVAEDLSPVLGTLRRYEQLFGVLAVAGLLAMLLLQRVILRRSFRRLAPVYRDIDALERGATSRLTEHVPAEILPLVRKLNGLLAVYEQRLTRSRNAAGNLAHALKGPLSLMRQQLRAPTEPEAGAPGHDSAAPAGDGTRRVCAAEVERITALVERELKRARIAGRARAGSVFDPGLELPDLKRLLLAMYRDKALDLDCRNRLPGAIALDREDLLEILGTLLDNACKWAVSRVRCTLAPADGGAGLRLLVEDDGPGCDAAELARIARRGERLDEQVDGHGLGLAIAREIAESYGGTLQLGRSADLGGFLARVDLPLPASA